jgi:hypothetical protein
MVWRYELLKREKAAIASKKSDGKKRIHIGTGGQSKRATRK